MQWLHAVSVVKLHDKVHRAYRPKDGLLQLRLVQPMPYHEPGLPAGKF